MDGPRSSPVPLEHYTRPSHGLVSDLDIDRASGGGDDLRDSNSFVMPMDFSPDNGQWVMNSLSSGDSGLHDWTNVTFDPSATSPMSFNLSETSFFGAVEGIGDQFRAMDRVNQSRTSSVNDLSESLQQQIFDTQRPLFQATSQHVPTTTMSGASQSGGWPFSGSTTLNLMSPDIVLEEAPSASSYTANSSYEPWSVEGQRRYRGFPQADAAVFGPHTDLMHEIAMGNTSWASSPNKNDTSTPSSTHSPSFPHATLDQDILRSTVPTTRPTLHLQVDRKPRQNPFHVPRSSPITAQAVHSTLTVSQKPCQSNFNLNLSQSPVSDFVVVPFPSQENSGQCAVESESFKSEAVQVEHATSPQISPQANQCPPCLVFGPQTFPAEDSSNNRVSSGLAQRKHSSGNGRRLGGRPIGSHLAPDKAARTKQMREEGSCWLCCLQRDSCTPGEICDRCIKRNQRATLEHGIGCDRTKLTELKSIFIPDVITRLHEFQTLKDFCSEHIKRWTSVCITLEFDVIWTLPPITCEVYEFEPKTRELLRQFQYIKDPHSDRRVRVERASPPLAMLAIEQADRHKYDRYLTMIVDKYLEEFAELVYDYQNDDFSVRLLRLMVRFKPDNKEEASLLREVHRLLVCTYIMCRTATIPQSQTPLLYNLHSLHINPNTYADRPSPRMANRQLKYLFCTLQQQILDSILKKLQQVLRSSKGPQKWTAAFISLLGLAMSFELVQRLVHTLMDAEATMGKYTERDADYIAEMACLAIDENFAFVRNLFRWKYHRGFNPLREVEQDNVKEVLGEKGVEFVRGIVALIMEKHDSFLFDRQYVSISTQNHHKYTSRLVARFLLPFWSPQ